METHVERISNLQDLERAKLDRDTGLRLYEDMILGRRFEDKCAEMYYRGKMFGFVHLYNGQEAISTGVIGAMKKKHDWFCSTYSFLSVIKMNKSEHLTSVIHFCTFIFESSAKDHIFI